MKTWIYVRQSQDRTGEELGVSRQRADAHKLAGLRDWTVTGELVENDASASGKRVRPKFEELLAAITRGEVDAVIAWDMTRLSRNRHDTVRLLEAGERAGVTLAFVRGNDLDLSTPAGQLTADILSSVARNEIKVKSDRQRRAAEQAAEQGRRIGGRRPFGYGPVIGTEERIDPKTGKVFEYQLRDYDRLIPEEAQALRDAYDAVILGIPLARIAADWNKRGLLTPQVTRAGKPSKWTAQTIRPVLLNPRYAGLRHHVTERMRETMHPVKARLANIVGPAAWPGVVSEEKWRAVAWILTSPDRAKPGRVGQRMLTGLALCGVCGALVHGGANRAKQPNYRCSAEYGHVGRRSEPVDDWIGRVVVAWLSKPEAANLLVVDQGPDAAERQAELGTLRTRLNGLAAAHADGDIDDLQLRTGSRKLRTRIQEIEGTGAASGRVSVLAPLIEAADPTAVWKGMDDDRRRAVVDELMTVTLLPAGRGTRTFRPDSVVILPKVSLDGGPGET